MHKEKPMTLILNPSARVLRQFAAAWLVVVSLIGLHQYFFRQHVQVGVVLIAVAVAFGFLGLFRPAAVRWLFVIAQVATFPIGWAVSQVALLLMFYGLITPLALLFRLRRRDLLNR